MLAMMERASNPEFQKMVEPYVKYHEYFKFNEIKLSQ